MFSLLKQLRLWFIQSRKQKVRVPVGIWKAGCAVTLNLHTIIIFYIYEQLLQSVVYTVPSHNRDKYWQL